MKELDVFPNAFQPLLIVLEYPTLNLYHRSLYGFDGGTDTFYFFFFFFLTQYDLLILRRSSSSLFIRKKIT